MPYIQPLLPLHLDRWINSSSLQKSIRRGHFDHALFAANHLLHINPGYLIRRLGVIAIEDIGPGNWELVKTYFDAIPELNLSPNKVNVWIERMCSSKKSRYLCDLCFITSDHPAMQRKAFELGWLTPVEQQNAWAQGDLLTRSALTHLWPFKDLVTVVTEPWVISLMRAARRSGSEKMELGIPLVVSESPIGIQEKCEQMQSIALYPAIAFDQHTRLGLAAVRKFTQLLPDIKLPFNAKVKVVGNIIFELESAILNREVIYAGHDSIRAMVREACVPPGYDPSLMTEWMNLVQQHWHRLHECRVALITSHNSQFSESI